MNKILSFEICKLLKEKSFNCLNPSSTGIWLRGHIIPAVVK
jgi:hypothetical protein